MRTFTSIGKGLVLVLAMSGCEVSTAGILSPVGCTNKVRVDAELHIDAGDERWIWGTDRQTGADVSLRLPASYGVRPSPPQIIDPNSQVIGRPGDVIVSGCRDIVQDAILIDDSDIR
jgi:hypothetical protein